MPRKKLIRTDQYFYHITTRSNNKEWFALPLSEVWDISTFAFKKAMNACPSVISQYVLMSNHYHLLIRTPGCDIDQFMFWFNKTISDEIRKGSGVENRIFGGHYKWSLITHSKYFANVFRYIYQNPLRAGIVDHCENYPYSTFHYTFFNKKLPFDFRPLSHFEENIDFINDYLDLKEQETIRKGLRRPTYAESRQHRAPK
jgi:putative transposase